MEEKCPDAADSNALDFENSSSTALPTSKDVTEAQDLLLHQPSTSRSSMSLLQDDFANSQHDFAEVLDDETTTSGMLETFEISSSNSLPTCSDPPGTVAVDDNSSTDTIKLVAISNPASCNNDFFNASEVYVINDDDDDDLDDVVERGPNVNTSQMSAGAGELGGQINGVIVTRSGATIYLETPVVEDQQHQQMMSMAEQLDFVEKAGKPKRLSDEFLLVEGPGPLLSGVAEGVSNKIRSALEASAANYNFDGTESPVVEKKSDSGVECSSELLHDRMSFRLKKMNINNAAAQEASVHAAAFNELPSSSLGQLVPTLTDIESMDLIERRDFETEQKLTGGVILKTSSLVARNMLSLNLIKSCIEQKDGPQQGQQDVGDDASSSSSIKGRAVSSDSKCAYKDPTVTPTSSRNYSSRLTKSTAKYNLCSIVSHPRNEQPQKQSQQTSTTTKSQRQKPYTSTSSVSSSTSVIVNEPSTSANVVNLVGGAGGEIFSNSNSNDSLMGGSTAPTITNCQQNEQEQPEREQQGSSTIDKENNCSRTSVLQPLLEADCQPVELDDAQPSTSSARCQYPPLKSLRQVHASAQTNERYLSRGVSSASPSAVFGGIAPATTNSVNSSGASGMNLSTTSRSRRRADSTPHLNRNNTSDDVVTVFKIVVENGVSPPEPADFSDDPWADCDELNSDMEEICTCHHSSTESSLGGSNTSLNDTDDLDAYGGGPKEGDLSNYIQMVSISEEVPTASSDCTTASYSGAGQQRKRKYNDGRLLEGDSNANMGSSSSGGHGDANNRKRIAYDYSSTPRLSQSSYAPVLPSTPSTQLALSSTGSPHGRRTPRSVIPTRDNPPPELQNWLTQFQRWSHVERLLAVDRLIEHCEPTQVRHMMKVIEPQFQRDFISLLPRELALQVLAYLEPKDLLRAAQTCRSWRFLCDDNLLWREKCRKAQILTESRTDKPKRGRAGNMPPIASPWKAAYMRQHIIEMNWRSRPIREPKVLKGHDDHVITCLQFSGNRIVSGSDDNTLKVWSAVTGRCLRTLIGHTGGVWSSQMSGNIIISGSTDRTLKVWDMDTGHCVHTLLGHTSTVRCMHLNGNKVVSGSRDATLRVWDIEQGTCLHVLVGHLAAVRCVQYDGKLIVSGAYDYMVKIWHPERQECLHTLQGHTNRVYSLQFDGIHVVSGSLDTSIRVWDVETGNCKHTLMGHQSLTSGMELRQNILVSGNADSTVKVWDITTGQCLQTLSGPNKHQSAVTCLQFNSRFVVTSSDDGTVKLWDVKTGDFIRNLVALDSGGSGGVVWRIRANDTKLICAVGSRNGTEETKLMVLDFDVEGACVKCS